jgi:hypothetical protein
MKTTNSKYPDKAKPVPEPVADVTPFTGNVVTNEVDDSLSKATVSEDADRAAGRTLEVADVLFWPRHEEWGATLRLPGETTEYVDVFVRNLEKWHYKENSERAAEQALDRVQAAEKDLRMAVAEGGGEAARELLTQTQELAESINERLDE